MPAEEAARIHLGADLRTPEFWLAAIDPLEADVRAFESLVDADSRGLRHAGPELFARMDLREKILANLITNETTLFRFTEGELHALESAILPRLKAAGRPARVLIVPCSTGDEAYTLAAYLLKAGVEFRIEAFDIQPAAIAEARTGRLTFGYPLHYLEQPGRVAPAVLDRIAFETGDVFAADFPPWREPHGYDVVLCRNFLGYFTPATMRELVEKLARAVAPERVLFLDGFCLQKCPELNAAIAAQGFARMGDRPVFLAG